MVRREKGLTGGFAGFFQRPFVEIEAKVGTPRLDLYDEDDAAPVLPPPIEQVPTPFAPAPTPFEQGPTPLTPFEQGPTPLTPFEQGPTPLTPFEQGPTPQPLRGAYASNSLAAFAGTDPAEQFRELTPSSLIERAVRSNGSLPTERRPVCRGARRGRGCGPAGRERDAPNDRRGARGGEHPGARRRSCVTVPSQPLAPRGRARAQIERASLASVSVSRWCAS